MCSVQILNLMRFHCKTARRRRTAHIHSQHFCVPIVGQMNEKNKRSLVEFEMSQTWDYPAIAADCCLVPSSSLQSCSGDSTGTLENKSSGFDSLTSPHVFFFLPQCLTGVVRGRDTGGGGQRLMGSCGKDMDGCVSWLGAVRTEKG